MKITDDQCDLDIQRILRAEIRDLRHRHQVELDLVRAAYSSRFSSHGFAGLPSTDQQCQMIKGSILFDEGWYLETYADVKASGMSAEEHYVRAGAFERRNPGPGFDTYAYYLRYPDVAKAGWPALVHYEALGRARGHLLD